MPKVNPARAVLEQPAAKAERRDRFGVRDTSGTKKFPDFRSAQRFGADNLIRVFYSGLRGELLRLEDMNNLGGISRDRIDLSQPREHAPLMIGLFN